MSEEDLNQSSGNDIIKSLRETDSRIIEKTKGLAREVRDMSESWRDLEARMRILELKDFEEIRNSLYGVESRIKSLEAQHNDRKEKWQIVINFVVQLIWVSMAAWVLTRLGLQGPL
jgi:predicted nuclease with TOPRIM domain